MSRNIFTKARLKAAAGVAGLTVAGVVIATLPGLAATSASWNDYEWVSGTQGDEPGVGTFDCEVAQFSTRGEATFLELDAPILNDVLELGNLLVTNDGSTSTSTPAVAPIGGSPAGDNQYLAPINLAALNSAITLGLPQISLPLNADLGVLASYGEAQPTGYSAAGSGLLTDTGGLDLEAAEEEDLEFTGSLSLDAVLDSILEDGTTDIDDVAGLDLNLGAVGSVASLDACPLMWDGDFASHLDRDYLIAALDLQVGSPLLDLITDELDSLLAALEVERLDALVDVSATLAPLLNGLLAPLELVADASVNLDVELDTTAITDLLTNGVLNGNDIVEIDLGSGLITIDLANLLGNPGTGLNGLPANTELLVDADVLEALTDALSAAIADLVTQLGTAVATVVSSIGLGGEITATIDILGTDVLEVIAPLNGDPVTTNVLGTLCADTPVLCLGLDATTGIVSGLLGGLVTTLTGLVQTTLDGLGTTIGLLDDTVIAALNLLDDVDSALFSLLSDLFDGLFLNGILSIVVNAQSIPTGNANPIPLNFVTPGAVPVDQYDIAAIRIGVLDLLGPAAGVDLTFARSSVGANIYLP